MVHVIQPCLVPAPSLSRARRCCVLQEEAEARLRAETASARQQSELRACISHEVRTPCNSTAGAAHLLKLTTLDEGQARGAAPQNAAAPSLSPCRARV